MTTLGFMKRRNRREGEEALLASSLGRARDVRAMGGERDDQA
jgi:hypothetical protein